MSPKEFRIWNSEFGIRDWNLAFVDRSETGREFQIPNAEFQILRGSAFQKRPQLAAPGRVPQLAQRLRLDLTDPLAGDGEALADLFERVLAPVAHAEPHLDHFLLARRQRLEDRFGLLLQIEVDHRFGR